MKYFFYHFQDTLFNYENVLLFASILDVTVINKKYNDKSISFEVNIGPPQKPNLKSHPDGPEKNRTSALQPKTHDKIYWYLPIEKEKPCLSIISQWPDFRRRMYNSNMITNIAVELVQSFAGIIVAII